MSYLVQNNRAQNAYQLPVPRQYEPQYHSYYHSTTPRPNEFQQYCYPNHQHADGTFMADTARSHMACNQRPMYMMPNAYQQQQYPQMNIYGDSNDAGAVGGYTQNCMNPTTTNNNQFMNPAMNCTPLIYQYDMTYNKQSEQPANNIKTTINQNAELNAFNLSDLDGQNTDDLVDLIPSENLNDYIESSDVNDITNSMELCAIDKAKN